jgi:hypothetical protein
MFHAKYISSSSLGSLKEDFLSFYYMHIGKINDPLGEILTPGLLFKTLGRHLLEDDSCQISKL